MEKLTGHFTLPAESGKEKEVLALAREYGADAIRNSDGTQLSPELLASGYEIYTTLCLARADQEYPRLHPEHQPQRFLMSDPVTAAGAEVVIPLLADFYAPKYRINDSADSLATWQVFDRTTGQLLPRDRWAYTAANGTVAVSGPVPFHVYTANFLVYITWDTTSMYNHLINQWDRPPVISVDPYQPEVYSHLMEYYDRWLAANPHTDVVRLTTLAFHFTVEFDGLARQKFRDWCGYTSDCVSPRALKDFAAQYGYALTAEDFVDTGQYNHLSRVPSRRYLDWMAFVRAFVIRFGKELVDKTHAAGKKAAFFWGDHWIGAEPFGDDFGQMGFDVAIGACEDGVALRRAADVPCAAQKEVRLYPYFFPDVFHKGGKPLEESRNNWIRIRRALLRKGVDRIGYGGYLSLALEFPKFIAHIRDLADEFRTILARSQGSESYKLPAKVAVLSSWGKIRSWMPTSDAAEKFTEQRGDVAYIQGSNLLECLSGLPFEVEFLSFDDIAARGIPRDVKVIINDGAAMSSWSGGEHWIDPAVVAAVKGWVHAGGGFIGVREPSAIWHQGRYFQMSDVLGVEKESGLSLGYPRRGLPADGRVMPQAEPPAGHFILRDQPDGYLPTTERSFVWPVAEDVHVLAELAGGHVAASAHAFGRGRGVYLAGLPFSIANCRLLHRAILWAAAQESAERTWFTSNPCLDVAAYPQAGTFVVVNNSDQRQSGTVWQDSGRSVQVELDGYKNVWMEI